MTETKTGLEQVVVVAVARFQWRCPNCGYINKLHTTSEQIECKNCLGDYEAVVIIK